MSLNHTFSRRAMLRTAMMGGIGLAAGGASSAREEEPQFRLKGNLKQSVNRSLLGSGVPIAELCRTVKELGISAIDAVTPSEWPVLKAHGLDCSLCYINGIELERGFGTADYQDELVANYLAHIDLVADAGYHGLFCFSGNRKGMDLEEGLANAEAGLKRVIGHAEKRGVVLMLELLSSKNDHPDYLGDRTEWGVELCKRVGSPNFGLLYDIYHMQIMEGDIIATIRKYHEYFVHYHTAGVPGREGLGDDQELNYPAICRAIVETGFQGYLAHEFFPKTTDKLATLREALRLCDV